jgi:GH25 family lysozyme M1 (1,4-beta-N-acetylmuramidase)
MEYVIVALTPAQQTQQVYNRNLRNSTDSKKKQGLTRPFKHFIKKTNKKARKGKISYLYNCILIREKILQNPDR